MKKSILMLFVAALALGAIAGSVSSDMAIAAANAWVAKNGQFNTGTRATGVLSVRDPENGVLLWHQVSMQGGGMLVVAPVTEIEPVVMALDNDPGELPAAHPLRGILMGDMRRRLQFLGLYRAAPSGGASLQSVAPAAPAAEEISEEAKEWGEASNAKWVRLAGGASLQDASVGLTNVAVEVSVVPGFEKGGALTHWNQGGDSSGKPVYNYHTPKHAVCGCVATACAALVQYFGAIGAVSVSNPCSYNGVRDFYTTKEGLLDWSILPVSYGGEAEDSDEGLTDEQRELLGRVTYNAGVGVYYEGRDIAMMWSDDESAAYEPGIVSALTKVFGFKNARYVRIPDESSPAQAELEKLIYNQCRAGAPVGMSIEGHSVVAVGYGLDDEGVERVRVFMGWGGSGDGWYALPKIDTKATMNGWKYLSEVVDGVVTMISCDDNDIVPVVGRLVGHESMAGKELMIEGIGKTFTANDQGYFGTRVPCDLSLSACKVTCQGKDASFQIGAAAAKSSDADALSQALPAAFEFSLLNCTVAYSPERAKELALREGKAILRVSGTGVETNTAAVLDLIYEFDEANTGDFTNKFVYVFSASSDAEGDGADVTYGVYLPEMFDPACRWQQPDAARLAWGYSVTVAKETNSTHNVEHVEAEGAMTNVFTYTYAPAAADPVVTTNAVDDVDAITADVLQSFKDVLAVGGRRFEESVSGIKVTIAATTEEAEEAIDKVAPPQDTCGLHERIYAPGSHTFVCDAVVTNEAAGLVMGCAGWTVTNATTGAVLSGAGSEATINLVTNDVLTLTWDFSKTNAVYITVKFTGDVEALDPEAVTPVSGWYPYGVPVQFQAKGKVGGYGFDYFKAANIPDGTIWLSETSVLVPVVQSGTVEVTYRRGKAAPVDPEPVTETCAVTVKNYVWDVATRTVSPADDLVPDTCVYSSEEPVEIMDGETADVPATMVYFAPSAIQYTTADGVKMEYYGVLVDDEIYVGESLPVEEDLEGASAATVMWVWKSVKDGDDPDEPPTDFQIEWDDALTVLNAHGFSTNLLTEAQIEKYGINIADVHVSAPKGFVAKLATDADGNIVATLELDEGVLKPVAADGVSSPLTILSNGDGTVTVKADVANGVRGFWYSLYATDELGGVWTLVASGYQPGGAPSVQATVDDESVSVAIDVQPTDAKRFYKLVVTDIDPSQIN